MASRRSILVLALLAGLAGLAAGCSHAHAAAQAGDAETPQVNSVLHLDSFLVNLQGGGYLRVGIDLGLNAPSKPGGESEPPIAPIRDTILNVLTASTAEPLLTADGKEQLKKQIADALNRQNPKLGLVAVYFTDFLVQQQ